MRDKITNRSTHKNKLYVYIPAMKPENQNLKRIPVTVTLRKMKYLDFDVIKQVQDLYAINYNTLMKEIKDLKKWTDKPCS